MLPLTDVRVLDLTTEAGFATLELADYGAEVIKVEKPGPGDRIRTFPPLEQGVSLFEAYVDRGKKSITLDLSTSEGAQVLRELVKDADVLVENFRVGTMERFGLGYEVLRQINPKLVYASLTAYGSTGPEKDRIAFDNVSQARAGNAHPSINPYDVVRCKDGFVALGISTDAQWAKFCNEFGKPEWVQDPRYCTNQMRGEHYFHDLRDKLEAHLMEHFTKAEISDRCAAIKVPAAAVETMADAIVQPQIASRRMLVQVPHHTLGSITAVGRVVKFRGEDPDDVFASAPLPGEHNDEILGTRLEPSRYAALKRGGVI